MKTLFFENDCIYDEEENKYFVKYERIKIAQTWMKIMNNSKLTLAIIIKMKNTSKHTTERFKHFLTCKICLSTVIDSTTF